MLTCDKLAPELAFTTCGAFSDPQVAYKMSLPYIQKAEQRKEKEQVANDGGGNMEESSN